MTQANWIVIQPEAWLLLAACFVTLVDLFVRDPERGITYWLTQAVAGIFSWLHLEAFSTGTTIYGLGGMVVADPLGHLLAGFAGIAVMVAVAYARPTLSSRDMNKGEFYSLTLFSLLGIGVMCSANNFLVIYLGLEVMSLSLYALVALRRAHTAATEAAMKFFVLGALASGFLLYGLSMMYGATGTLEIPRVFEQIASGRINTEVLALGLVFIVAGLAFKLGAVPFHMWVPDVYEGAPTAITLLIGSAPELAGFAIAIRLLVEGLLGLAPDWQQMLIVMAVASLVVGNVAAIAQTNIKRMLAYSMISHMGFVLLGLSAGVVSGNTLSAGNAYSSALFYIVVYVLTTLGSFGTIMYLSRQGFEAEEIQDFAGLNRRSPWAAGVMAVFLFSLAGVPPLFGFFAKLLVLKAAIDAGFLWLAIVAIVFAIIGLYYYLRVVKVMYFDTPADEATLPLPADLPLRWVISLNGLALVALGFLWGPLFDWCNRAFGVS